MPRVPELPEVMQQIFDSFAARLRAIEPGEVVSWNRSEQWANIQPLVRDQSGTDRAIIEKVPVIQPTAYHDVQTGEVGLLLICDRNPARWWRDNQQSDPESAATHHIANAVFIPGLRSKDEARTFSADTAVLERPAVGGEVRLGVAGATRAVLHDNLTPNLNAFLTALQTWAGSVDAAIPIPPPNDFATVVSGALSNLQTANYASPSVKVED